MLINGYKRANGTCGIRNHLAIIPASVCSSDTAVRIAAQVQGAVAMPHQHGCCQVGDDVRQTIRTLIGMGTNPNVGAVLVVGLGCEGIQARDIAAKIETSGKPVAVVIIQDHGGSLGAIHEGTRIASRLAQQLSMQEKTAFDIGELILALECGGSDPTSGIAANPALGKATETFVHLGGSAILSETTEMIGAEHLLAERAVSKEVGDALIAMVKRVEKRADSIGEDLRGTQPTPGNIVGGLTTIEEKSLGCIYKAGNLPLLGVLEYGEAVPREPKGLYFMDTPGEDIDSIIGMLAGGAQIVVFTTGRGTPTGSPIAPVIKVTGNSETFRRMNDNMDINAGKCITDGYTLDQSGHEIFDEIVAVANGKLTKAESLGHQEFAIFRVGYTF